MSKRNLCWVFPPPRASLLELTLSCVETLAVSLPTLALAPVVSFYVCNLDGVFPPTYIRGINADSSSSPTQTNYTHIYIYISVYIHNHAYMPKVKPPCPAPSPSTTHP